MIPDDVRSTSVEIYVLAIGHAESLTKLKKKTK